MKSALALTSVFALVACQNLQTREDIKGARPGSSPTPASGTPSPSVQAPITLPPPTPPPGQPTPAPTFLNKELPKVGVILGPGGFKTFSHLGVLREMARARIPIHAITGLEWGAVMASLYSIQGQVNDAEWKAFKLREGEVPSEGGFMSSRLKAAPTSTLRDFFDSAYGSATIEKSKVDFSCPSYSPKTDRTTWFGKGSMKEAVSKCMAYPPMYAEGSGALASPFSVEEAAAWLRSKGANVVILVNALGQGEYLPAKLNSEHYLDNVLWSEIRREMLRAKPPAVNHVINVNTTGHPMTDFAGRRALMDAGQKSAADSVGKIVSQYGF